VINWAEINWAELVPISAIRVAALAAVLAYVRWEFESWRSRKRELKGLLRLLAVEIKWNQSLLKFFSEQEGRTLSEAAEGAGFETRAWEENKARIAELIKDGKDLQLLADYFMNIAVFEKERLVPEKNLELMLHISSIQEQGKKAQEVVDREVGEKVRPQVEAPALEAPKDNS
jgi:hypothetical protein